ncbi:neuronal acetylcholine receptor subunit alpha-2-like [Glandiceps talaboti]
MKINPTTLVTFAVILTGHWASADYVQSQLMDELLRLYDSRVVPLVFNKNNETNVTVTEPVTVEVGMSLISIDEVDMKRGKLKAVVWLKQTWIDKRLSWTPEDHGNVNIIRIDQEELWKPDIILYNGMSTPIHQGKVLIYPDGMLYYIPSYQMEINCNVDAYYFPYDQQRCLFKFGSWVYSGELIDLKKNSVDLVDFYYNIEWSVDNARIEKHVVKYPCCMETYHDVTVYLTISRKSHIYSVSLVIPSILVSLSLLFAFVFPPVCREKMTLAVAILLALLLLNYMTYITVGLPSILGNFLLFTVILSLLVIGETSIVYNVFHRTGKVPKLVRNLFIDCLGRIMCVSPTKATKYEEEMQEKESQTVADKSQHIPGNDWNVIAKVIDRLSFYLYLIVYIIGSCVILTPRPESA